jgi:molybdopterin synthase catalytic subunit
MDLQIQFTTAPIVIPHSQIPTRETGAEVEFRGIVRETEKDRAIPGLYYEAHIPMAERHIRRILDQLKETAPCQSVLFIHRLGWVPVGEPSLYIRVHASHRGPAFTLCALLIDRLKQDVPIWKQTDPPSNASTIKM